MIELKVDISRVEYSDVFDRYIPNLLNSLKEKGESNTLRFVWPPNARKLQQRW